MAATSSGSTHAETLLKLERLNQLETITAEQRIRIEKYRTMYETVKADHDYLEEEKKRHSNEVSSLKDEMKILECRCQELISLARNELNAKVDECEELKMKVFTPQKIDIMKLKLQEEVEAQFRQKLESMEIEVDRYRNEFNRLRYDYSFLKSEYEHEVSQKKNLSEELLAKFNFEKDGLQKQIMSLTEQLNNQDPADRHKLRTLQKDNTQLNLRLKSVLSELEELRDKKETSNLQLDQVSRLQARQISEMSLKCKSLESELETNKQQQDRLQKELTKYLHEQDTLSAELHQSEKENMQLKSQIEEFNHKHKMEMNNAKLNFMSVQSNLERERDSLLMDLNTYKGKLKILELNSEELKKSLEEKEGDVIKRVQKVKEEEWDRINKLENSKAQLESQVALLEQQKIDAHNIFKAQIEQLEQQLKNEKDCNERTERECVNQKSLLTQEKQHSKHIESEIERLQEIKQKYQKLKVSYDELLKLEQEGKSEIEKLSQTISLVRKELDFSQQDLQKQQEAYMQASSKAKTYFHEEQKKLAQKYTEEHKLHKKLKKKFEKVYKTSKKKVRKLTLEVATLQEQLQMQKTKEDHCESEKQALKKSLDLEQQRMRRRFEKFRQRQHQFSHVLNASNFNMPDFASSPKVQSGFGNYMPRKSSISPLADIFESISVNDDNGAP